MLEKFEEQFKPQESEPLKEGGVERTSLGEEDAEIPNLKTKAEREISEDESASSETENNESAEAEEYSFEPEIEELKEPIRDLLSQLHEHIDSGSYKLLIGGDASARIPTLVFDKVIKRIYAEKGFETPRTLSAFIAGGVSGWSPLDEKSKKISVHIEKRYTAENLKSRAKRSRTLIERIREKLGVKNGNVESGGIKYDGRVLVVEDTISSGRSIKPVADALGRMGVEFDVATIGLLWADTREQTEGEVGGKIFSSLGDTPSIYGREDLSGVEKTRVDLFSRRIKLDVHNKTYNDRPDRSKKARLDVDKVAHELADWYLDTF